MNTLSSKIESTEEIRQKQQFRRTLISLFVMSLVFTVNVAYGLSRYIETIQHPLRKTDYPNRWIRAAGVPSQAGYFRKTFDLPGPVRHAWIKIAAAEAFEVNVNRNPSGRQYLWRPTRPFQSGTSEKGQILSWREPALALNFPRDYQWDGHDNWRLATFIELTSNLRPGRNVIGIEAESRTESARVTFEGEIQLWSGEVIPIQSDESWCGEPAPLGPQFLDWTEIQYWDNEWRKAVACEGPATHGLRSVPEAVYRDSFQGQWIRHRSASGEDAIVFSVDWEIDKPIDEAWLRLIGNRGYELYVNDTRVRVSSVKPPDLDNGDWIFGRAASFDPTTKPELLDPDEIGSTFVGKQFENPRKADAQLELFNQPFAPANTPFRYKRVTHRAQEAGVIEPIRTLAESRRTPNSPDLFPERPQPNALKHDLSSGGYLAYNIGKLLGVGINRIEMRCLAKRGANWPTQMAMDGGAIDASGHKIDFPHPYSWVARRSTEPENEAQSVSVEGPAFSPGDKLPAMQYRGVALNSSTFRMLFPWFLAMIGLVVELCVITILTVAWYSNRHNFIGLWRFLPWTEATSAKTSPLWLNASQTLYATMLTSSVTIGAAVLLEASLVERHEILWWMDGTAWKIVFVIAGITSCGVCLVDRFGRVAIPGLKERTHGFSQRMLDIPHSTVWRHLLIWILLLGGLLRG